MMRQQIWKLIKINSYSHCIVFKKNKPQNPICFITQSYFKVYKTLTLSATHHFIMKISNKKVLQQITSNHSSNIE